MNAGDWLDDIQVESMLQHKVVLVRHVARTLLNVSCLLAERTNVLIYPFQMSISWVAIPSSSAGAKVGIWKLGHWPARLVHTHDTVSARYSTRGYNPSVDLVFKLVHLVNSRIQQVATDKLYPWIHSGMLSMIQHGTRLVLSVHR